MSVTDSSAIDLRQIVPQMYELPSSLWAKAGEFDPIMDWLALRITAMH